MFKKFFAILILVLVGLVATLLLAWPENFAEKLLPFLMVGGVVAYLFLSWYLGYFLASQKPPLALILIATGALVVSFLSGYYIALKK